MVAYLEGLVFDLFTDQHGLVDCTLGSATIHVGHTRSLLQLESEATTRSNSDPIECST